MKSYVSGYALLRSLVLASVVFALAGCGLGPKSSSSQSPSGDGVSAPADHGSGAANGNSQASSFTSLGSVPSTTTAPGPAPVVSSSSPVSVLTPSAWVATRISPAAGSQFNLELVVAGSSLTGSIILDPGYVQEISMTYVPTTGMFEGLIARTDPGNCTSNMFASIALNGSSGSYSIYGTDGNCIPANYTENGTLAAAANAAPAYSSLPSPAWLATRISPAAGSQFNLELVVAGSSLTGSIILDPGYVQEISMTYVPTTGVFEGLIARTDPGNCTSNMFASIALNGSSGSYSIYGTDGNCIPANYTENGTLAVAP